MYMLTNGRLILYTLSWQPPFQGLKACTFWCFTLYDIEYHKRLLPIKVFITSLEGRCFFILPFPQSLSGNPESLDIDIRGQALCFSPCYEDAGCPSPCPPPLGGGKGGGGGKKKNKKKKFWVFPFKTQSLPF